MAGLAKYLGGCESVELTADELKKDQVYFNREKTNVRSPDLQNVGSGDFYKPNLMLHNYV